MSRSESKIDRIKAKLMADPGGFIRSLLPGGHQEGGEWVALNPTRADASKGSFKINLQTGRWGEFSNSADRGDLIDLYQYVKGCDRTQALAELDNRPRVEPVVLRSGYKPDAWDVITPVPSDAPKPYFNRHGQPSAVYEYRNLNNELLGYTVRVDKVGGKDVRPLTFCKNQRTGKTQWYWQSWPKPTPLYGLETFSDPARAGNFVLLVEGEKAADAAKMLAPSNPIATWLGGTGQVAKADWSQLAGKAVVIWPDRDSAGRTAAKTIATKLKGVASSVFILSVLGDEDADEDGFDLADALALGWTVEQVEAVIRHQLPIAKTAGEHNESDKDNSAVKRKPTFDDYRAFFIHHLKDVRRDLLTGRLYFRNDEQNWRPVANFREALESHAIDSDVGLAQTHVKPHLARFTEELPKSLLVDIPKWDGADRISKFASAIRFKSCSAGERISEFFEEQLKAWGADLFKRVEDPSKQNKVFILKGPQGIGKDTFIKAILEGFGHYYVQPTLSRDEKENFITLAGSIAVHIPEFDRTTKIEVSALKNLITTETALFRWPYDREPTRCQFRYSIMSSCNVDDILRDSTGNRRFVIFELEYIDWTAYPCGESLQLLAQFKSLAAKNFKVSEDAERAMTNYILDKTPMSTDSFILDAFDSMMAIKCGPMHQGLSLQKVAQELADIARQNEVTVRSVQSLLARSGRSKKTKIGILYLRVTPAVEVLANRMQSRRSNTEPSSRH